tara:strand:- start:117 stop:674 length:558 start_codon:yes stop_codon:yes gene_type:complete
MKKKWKVLKSKKVYNSNWIKLFLQKIVTTKGVVINDFHRIEIKSSVVVLPITRDNQIILIETYKHGIGENTFSLPAGYINKYEKPIVAAKRELLEETGYKGLRWKKFGKFVSNSNYYSGEINFYVTYDSIKIGVEDSGDLEDIKVHKINIKKLKKLINNNKIKSLSSAYLIQKWLNLSDISNCKS